MIDPQQLIDAWNEPNRDARHMALSALLAENLIYVDPHQSDEVNGRAAYLEFWDQLRTMLPASRFALLSSESHHRMLRLVTQLDFNNGQGESRGQFIIRFDDDDRIALLSAFGP